MRTSKLLAALGVATALAVPASAQHASITAEAMKVEDRIESHLVRLTGGYGSNLQLSGFVDLYGEDNYFGKIFLRKKLSRDVGLQAEVNYLSYDRTRFRFGPKFDFKRGKFYANVRVLPLCFNTAGFLGQTVIQTYAELRLGKYYVENWSQHNFNYNKPDAHTDELTVGRKIGDHLGIQVQLPYNVDAPGLTVGAGVRYRLP